MTFNYFFDEFQNNFPVDVQSIIPDPFYHPDAFYSSYSSLGRRFRKVQYRLTDNNYLFLNKLGIPDPAQLSLDELVRIAFLNKALASYPLESHVPLIYELFRTGDNAERESIVKTLVLLPEPGRFLEIALDACRSSVQTTVEAISLNNSYPDRFFSPDAFRVMVLKALHLGIDLQYIYRLEHHIDNELTRMADAYISECQSAGRPISDQIQFLNPGTI